MLEFLKRYYNKLFKWFENKQSQKHEIIKGRIMYWQTIKGLADIEHQHTLTNKCGKKIKRLQEKLNKRG